MTVVLVILALLIVAESLGLVAMRTRLRDVRAHDDYQARWIRDHHQGTGYLVDPDDVRRGHSWPH